MHALLTTFSAAGSRRTVGITATPICCHTARWKNATLPALNLMRYTLLSSQW